MQRALPKLVSLLKEYRRELGRYYCGERVDYPPVPEHYFDAETLARIEDYKPILEAAKATGGRPPGLSEDSLIPAVPHTWTRDGQVIYCNWLHRIAGEAPG